VKNTVLVLENAATATIYGLEGEFTVRPIEAPADTYDERVMASCSFR
jgi:hypothetical protein